MSECYCSGVLCKCVKGDSIFPPALHSHLHTFPRYQSAILCVYVCVCGILRNSMTSRCTASMTTTKVAV